jgi:hypothetical protein
LEGRFNREVKLSGDRFLKERFLPFGDVSLPNLLWGYRQAQRFGYWWIH